MTWGPSKHICHTYSTTVQGHCLCASKLTATHPGWSALHVVHIIGRSAQYSGKAPGYTPLVSRVCSLSTLPECIHQLQQSAIHVCCCLLMADALERSSIARTAARHQRELIQPASCSTHQKHHILHQHHPWHSAEANCCTCRTYYTIHGHTCRTCCADVLQSRH